MRMQVVLQLKFRVKGGLVVVDKNARLFLNSFSFEIFCLPSSFGTHPV